MHSFISPKTKETIAQTKQFQAYGDFILDHTPNYVQRRPASYPRTLSWPSTNTIVDSLAEMSRLNWPYVLLPFHKTPYPANLSNLTDPSSPQSYSPQPRPSPPPSPTYPP